MMLTGDLVRATVKGKQVLPSLIDPCDPKLIELAELTLGRFAEAELERAPRGQLLDALRSDEGTDTRVKLRRGLAKVLLDKCVFETVCPLDPKELRQRVFKLAAARGPVARGRGAPGRVSADAVLAEAIADLEGAEDWTAEMLRDAIYADLKDAQRLQKRTGPRDCEALLHRYNVALVQAVLLKSTELRLRLERPAPKRMRQLFRYLKFFQLMYRVRRGADGALELTVDGPASLLRSSTRYGLQLATFLPAVLLHEGEWSLEADLLWGKKRKLRKILRLERGAGLRSHYRDTGVWRSNAEKWFEERFEKVDTPWTLEPGGLIDLGDQSLLVPDFTLRNGDRVAHVDIVGFWRKGYLRQRLADTPDNVILAVSKRLVGDTVALPGTIQRQIVSFAEIISVPAVLERAEKVAI